VAYVGYAFTENVDYRGVNLISWWTLVRRCILLMRLVRCD